MDTNSSESYDQGTRGKFLGWSSRGQLLTSEEISKVVMSRENIWALSKGLVHTSVNLRPLDVV